MENRTLLKLYNGNELPVLGYGTWQISGADGVDSIVFAIKSGYRHIDTAQVYQNEECVGKAVDICIKEGIVKRQDLYISSKLNFFNPIGYRNTVKALYESLGKLGLDYLDNYLIHWPNFTPDDSWKYLNASSWSALEDLYSKGVLKNLGVSNFLVHHLEELFKTAQIKPSVNQLNLSPQWQQKEVVQFCKQNGITPISWSANMKIENWNRHVLKHLAEKYKVSVSQLCYRWAVEKGYSVLARSSNIEHIEQNMQIFNFKIEEQDMLLLDDLNSHPSNHNQHPDVMYGVYQQEEILNQREFVAKESWYLFGIVPPVIKRKNVSITTCTGCIKDNFEATKKGLLRFKKKKNKIKVYLFNFLLLGTLQLKVRKTQVKAIPHYEGDGK